MIEDDYKRILALAEGYEGQFRRRFQLVLRQVKRKMDLKAIERLIGEGRIEDALALAEAAALGLAGSFSAKWNALFQESAQAAAVFLSQQLGTTIDFDLLNVGAISAMERNKLALIREIVAEQRVATQQAILDGLREGLNPNEVARTVRDSIGLTQRQMAAVANYRRMLTQGSSAALDRALRDARFDRTVRGALGTGNLTREQIGRMVERYQERYVDYRARVISRTEAIRVANQGNHQLYIQAIDDGKLVESEIERKWVSGRDARTRESHRAMQGQKRGIREPFRSGDGNSLLYPGDPSAPASDTVQCRCAIATRLKRLVAA